MKVNEKLLQMGINPNEADFNDVWTVLDKPDSLMQKKEEVAASLVMLLAHNDTSRSKVAEITGIKKSQVTRILSGLENLTLRTIHEVCKAVGYEFDVVFREKSQAKPLQPWQTIDIFFEKTGYKPLHSAAKPVRTAIYEINITPSSGANDDVWNYQTQLELAAA